MKIPFLRLALVCLILIIFTCKKPYSPTIVSSNQAYFVVEGVINSGTDSTVITLSRSVKLNGNVNSPETGARVMVESDKKDQFTLTETVPGSYVIVGLNLPTDRNYRLHIFTSKNKEYVSDYVENKITPPIDSVYPKSLATGVQFYVSSHDTKSKTRYYRWQYGEEWSYILDEGKNPSVIVYRNGAVVPRNPDSLIDICYKSAVPSNNIFLASSDKLSQDVIYQAPLGYVDGSTGKITNTYSLLVKQYALTADAYKYWTLLKTNTEQLGSITDAQPSSSLTNLHSVTNPQEPVIGYVSVSTIATKRIFLYGRTLPFAVNEHSTDTVECAGGTIPISPASTLDYRLRQTLANGDTLLIAPVHDLAGNLIGYSYSQLNCVDCRTRGGTINRPSYWPDIF
jgi:hypothetical protein